MTEQECALNIKVGELTGLLLASLTGLEILESIKPAGTMPGLPHLIEQIKEVLSERT